MQILLLCVSVPHPCVYYVGGVQHQHQHHQRVYYYAAVLNDFSFVEQVERFYYVDYCVDYYVDWYDYLMAHDDWYDYWNSHVYYFDYYYDYCDYYSYYY